jgi:hypothetical protein
LGGLLPGSDGSILLNFIKAVQNWLIRKVVQFLATEIVVASFHVADAKGAIAVGEERLLKKWNIFVKQLLLQVLGAGGDDDAFARADRRHKISERLSSTGSGLDDQVAPFFNGLFDCLCHLQLAAAKLVRGMSAGEQSAGRKEVVERNRAAGRGRTGGLKTRGHRVSIVI